MNAKPLSDRLAVCSWSLQPTSAGDFFQKLAATGLTRVSIALDPIRENAGGAWSDFQSLCARQGVTCVSGMMTAIGEDYSTLDSIKRTGGWCRTSIGRAAGGTSRPTPTWRSGWGSGS